MTKKENEEIKEEVVEEVKEETTKEEVKPVKEDSKKVKKMKKNISVVMVAVIFIGALLGIIGTACLYELTDFHIINKDTKESSSKEDDKKDSEKEKDTEKDKDTDKENDKDSDKGKDKDNDDEKEDKKDKSRELSSSEKKKLLGIVDELSPVDALGKNISSPKKLSSKELLSIAVDIGELTQNDKFTLSQVEDILDEYFEEYSFTPEDFYDGLCNDPYFKYDSSKKAFVYNEEHAGHGGPGMSAIQNRFVSGKYEDGEYEITVYKVFSNISELGYPHKFYATYNDAVKEKNEIYEIDIKNAADDYMGPTDKDIKKILDDADEDDLVEHTYTFVQSNGGYKLVSYKIG